MSSSDLCPTGKVVTSVLDGANERAVLLSDDGSVLYMNTAAHHFLCHSHQQVTDFLAIDGENDNNGGDWKTMTSCRIVMKDGKITRNPRNIHLQTIATCPCCNKQHYVMFICSKHEQVRNLVDHAFDAVITINCSGTICTVNSACTELFGYTEKEMVGQNISIICGGGHSENHDHYIQNYLESGHKKIIGKKRQSVAKKRCGTEFPCELGIQEISDVSSGNKRYFVGFIKDLTLVKKQEAEIQERQALMQGMINASFDPMIEIDQAGIINLVNDATCNLFGYTKDELIGSNISILCGDGHGDKHAEYMKRYMDTGVKRIVGRKRQVKARRKNGSEIEVELGVQEVVLGSGKRAFCGYMRDLTQQKADKRALRKQQQLIHGKFFGTSSSGDSLEE
jgi:PAS domain S-box-containing protein